MQEYTKVLKTSCFIKWVAQVTPDHKHNCLYVELKSPILKLQPRPLVDLSFVPTLDLHPKKSKDTKLKSIHRFITSSALKGYPQAEIITGRGLNNPRGVMGIQWRFCKDVLTRASYKPYIRSIRTTSKEGAWLITLIKPEPQCQAHSASKNRNKRALKRSVCKKELKTMNKSLKK